jgi:aryl-alcohol dehydrogenase-like predicted oxidoreductase
LPADDHRRNDPRFQELQLSVNLDLVEQLKEIAERQGRTVSQLALAWTLRRPEVTAAIVGTRHPSQLEETLAAGDWILEPAEIAVIEDLLQQRQGRLR